MFEVRALKDHVWQGKERKAGDVYEVDEADTCVNGARILGLSERVIEEKRVEEKSPRRGRYAGRNASPAKTADMQAAK